ncbi:MAG: sigma-70 family RNA polymerase sigma factor [Verrucomicrobia bacterium]|nr:sigma-70 family RNA polymerase sigma factor [Verrucomicrobiota bacterium]
MNASTPDSRPEKLEAFERLVAAYEAPLLRYATRLLGNADLAQDVVQNAFLTLFRKWRDALEPSPQLSSWLYRVTHNSAVDYLRREKRLNALHTRDAEERPQELPPDRGAAFLISEEAAAAARALHALDPREQQLVILKVYEEKSYREISEISGLSVSNVGYILHHAMKKLAVAIRAGRTNPES